MVSDTVKKCIFDIMDSSTVIKYCVCVFNFIIIYFTFLEVDSPSGEVDYSNSIHHHCYTKKAYFVVLCPNCFDCFFVFVFFLAKSFHHSAGNVFFCLFLKNLNYVV